MICTVRSIAMAKTKKKQRLITIWQVRYFLPSLPMNDDDIWERKIWYDINDHWYSYLTKSFPISKLFINFPIFFSLQICSIICFILFFFSQNLIFSRDNKNGCCRIIKIPSFTCQYQFTIRQIRTDKCSKLNERKKKIKLSWTVHLFFPNLLCAIQLSTLTIQPFFQWQHFTRKIRNPNGNNPHLTNEFR